MFELSEKNQRGVVPPIEVNIANGSFIMTAYLYCKHCTLGIKNAYN